MRTIRTGAWAFPEDRVYYAIYKRQVKWVQVRCKKELAAHQPALFCLKCCVYEKKPTAHCFKEV